MTITCKTCGRRTSVKGHAHGTKTFRDLTERQQRAAIAKMARDLKEAREIYRGLR